MLTNDVCVSLFLVDSRPYGVQEGVHIIFPLHLRLKYPKTPSLGICCLFVLLAESYVNVTMPKNFFTCLFSLAFCFESYVIC